MKSVAYYVYGITAVRPLAGSISGIDKRYNLFKVPSGDIACVTSEVELTEFGEGPLKKNLESLDWVREKVWAHERVIETVMKEETIIPMKFCVIFKTREKVTEMIKQKYGFFKPLLDRYAGKQEWALKIYSFQKPERVRSKSSGGRAYLLAKKAEQEEKQKDECWLNTVVSGIYKKIQCFAVESRFNRTTPKELMRDIDKEQILNVSLLIDEKKVDEFITAVNAVAEEYINKGLAVEITGPLPVYSFLGGDIYANSK